MVGYIIEKKDIFHLKLSYFYPKSLIYTNSYWIIDEEVDFRFRCALSSNFVFPANISLYFKLHLIYFSPNFFRSNLFMRKIRKICAKTYSTLRIVRLL